MDTLFPLPREGEGHPDVISPTLLPSKNYTHNYFKNSVRHLFYKY